ncbi:hypothetical protein CN553_12690 [Bacillus cereus]|uniref:Uncharacterized protein n=1 Tax=Bacillus cereus TaxID=1396 RepID=A0A9X6YMC5_BACCE|nr:hypothetical protein [Bacillus cereus]PEN97888.1 hypothetical protein CN553_12690 [Bacillus cereus]
MDNIKIVQGYKIKKWFKKENEERFIDRIEAYVDGKSVIVDDLEKIDDDKYYFIVRSLATYIVIKEVSFSKSVYDMI